VVHHLVWNVQCARRTQARLERSVFTVGQPMNEQEMGAERELVADVLSLSSRIQQHLQPDTPLELSGERRRQTADLREQIAEMRERIRRMRDQHLRR
jgi:hypothetical protein